MSLAGDIKDKIVGYLERDPKKTFFAMIVVIILSATIVFIVSTNRKEQTFEEVMQVITTPDGKRPQNVVDPMPGLLDLGDNYLKAKEIERSLDSLNRKQILTPDDSIKARILLQELRKLIKK